MLTAPPVITESLRDQTVVEGEPVEFRLKVSGNPPPTIKWYLNGKEIPSQPQPSQTSPSSGPLHTCTLTVLNCSTQDIGHYTCCALNVTGRDVCSAELFIKGATDRDETEAGVAEVYVEPLFGKLPSSSSSSSPLRSGSVDDPVLALVGETARLDCKISGHPVPDLTWYKDGRELIRGGRYLMSVNQEGVHSLIIKLAKISDSGVYTCRASNRAGQATKDIFLNVEGNQRRSCPLFVEKLRDVEVNDGDPVEMKCTVAGYPAPVVSWLRNGKDISLCKDYIVKYDLRSGVCQLSIKDCMPDDSGAFVCIARNSHG
ncbi:hypothetical protein HELRODRAFT_76139, partial [Helobdella robusta]|uniref:Ig-like domain-containing protein n=1 Tax=Helobdella robusta TaxID=6412 RepID=T1G2F5_HELRO